ncbi:hypothetical protein A0H81_14902 [Grifola frondosa]|uniref:Uncharacterized protein n=1 Tax=Grifola frondosa TaxID=5627 RepID=A0A1C7LMF5_GRIFR|nr:hypothetical protein A0H81_14902 [Grifola frondosa]
MADKNSLLYLANVVNAIDDLTFFAYHQPRADQLPLPANLARVYSLRWILVLAESHPQRKRWVYIAYVKDAGPTRCRSALANGIWRTMEDLPSIWMPGSIEESLTGGEVGRMLYLMIYDTERRDDG